MATTIPTNASGVTPPTATTTTETQYYTCKYGRIAILNDENYSLFRQTCKVALLSANAWRIVTGDEPRPANNARLLPDWDQRAARAIQIMSNSVTPNILHSIDALIDATDAVGIWTELAKHNRSLDPMYQDTLVYRFTKETWDPKTEPLSNFLDKLNTYRTQLAGTPKAITEADLLTRLLHSLPEDSHWQQARHFCLNENRSLESAVTLLKSYQPAIIPKAITTATANAAQASRSQSRGRNKVGRREDRSKSRGRKQNYKQNYKEKNRDQEKPESDQCRFCMRKGHYQAECREYKKAQTKAREKVKENSKKKEERVNTVTEISEYEDDDSSLYTSNQHVYAVNGNQGWIIDSGASKHFSGSSSDFEAIKRWNTPRVVRLADGSTIEAQGYGDVILQTTKGNVRLKEVWYTPSFYCKLVSIRVLDDGGATIIFKDQKMKALKDQRILFEGSRIDGLYYVDQPIEKAFTTSTPENTTQARKDRELWHTRLAHINYKSVDKMRECSVGVQYRYSQPENYKAGETACEPCLAGKMKESFNKSTDSREEVKLRRIHCDLSGIRVKSIRGYQYFLVAIDDATRAVWIRHLRSKEAAEVVPAFRQLQKELEREANMKIVFVRADNGKGEFGSMFQDHLSQEGMQFEPCPPYKHSMNGVAERLIQMIDQLARSMLYQAKLPPTMWCYATEHAVWIRNRTPTSALPFSNNSTAETPYESYNLRKPDVRNLRVFGCAAYPHNSLQRMPAHMDPRIRGEYIFVGLRGRAIFRVLNTTTLKEEVYGNVDFNEYKFPRLPDPTDELLNTRKNPPTKKPVEDPSENPIKSLDKESRDGRALAPDSGRVLTPNSSLLRPPVEQSAPDNSSQLRSSGGSQQRSSDDSQQWSSGGSQLRSSESSAETGRRVETDASMTEIGPAEGKGRKPALNPNIFKATRSGRIPRKTVFPDGVSLLIEESKVVHMDGESNHGIPTAPFEAITIEEAMKTDSESWKKAIIRELQSLKETNTYSIVKIPQNRKVISSKWVCRIKFRDDGEHLSHKARLVIRGFEQQYGVDYAETFASVLKFATLRVLLAKAAAEDLEIDQMDVDTAFLNPELQEEVYMEIPEFFELVTMGADPKQYCLRLRKALYGLKQAPRVWFLTVNAFFADIGFKPSNSDPNLFVKNGVYILLFVDDMLIIGKRLEVDHVKVTIKKKWRCKDLGEAKLFIGFQIQRNRTAKSLRIHQTLYITKLLERFKMKDCNAVQLPIPAGTVLVQPSDLSKDEDEAGEHQLLDKLEANLYCQIVGSLLYLVNCTRLDLSYAVGQLARHMSKPRLLHLRLGKRTLRYLKGTISMGILYNGTNHKGTNAYTLYSDATWGTESDRVSFQGWAATRANGAILWTAQRQRSTAQSSLEAEFMSGSEASKEAAWLEKLTNDLNEKYRSPPTLFIDNLGAIDLIHDHKFHKKSKHIDIRYNYI